MWSWLKQLRPAGKVRLEGEAVDQDGRRRAFTAKLPYEGWLRTVSEDEVIDQARRRLLVNNGYRAYKIRIVGSYDTHGGRGPFTGRWYFFPLREEQPV